MKLSNAEDYIIAAFRDWAPVARNWRVVRADNHIRWKSFAPTMKKGLITGEDLLEIFDAGQYSFALIDGSLFQLDYQYRDENTLLSARLSFLKSVFSPEMIDASPKEIAFLAGESVAPTEIEFTHSDAEDELVPWVRIDYAPEDSSSILHAPCHMHLSGWPEARVAVRDVPTPRQFIEFVMANFLPDVYRKHRVGKGGALKPEGILNGVNRGRFTGMAELEPVAHLKIP